jgi:predicted AlkP superfamily pyrophosphatase or phosphodiesterase
MQPVAVILVVGLNESLIGDHCPRIKAFAEAGHLSKLKPTLPAVTCSVQASMLTGKPPAEHGIVANGWYNESLSEIQFWQRSNKLMQGEKIWDSAKQRDLGFTCLNVFWRYAAYSNCDHVVIERPIYKADGRKLEDIYCNDSKLRDHLQQKLGTFPLFNFWGPNANIKSTRWITDATIEAHRKTNATLTLTYLSHLDYCLQVIGPDHPDVPDRVREVDHEVGKLLDYFEGAGVTPIIVSEYGIEPVDDAVHINRALRKAGYLDVREEDGCELLEPGTSAAFAVSDHQVAHVYLNAANHNATEDVLLQEVASLCRDFPGVEQVLDKQAQQAIGIAHERSGDLVLIAEKRRWFSYYYWLDENKAPDFARTVEIHRKPGYDPCEMILDPTIPLPMLKIAWRLFQKKVLKQRALMDFIPLDPSLVGGSHGRVEQEAKYQPVVISSEPLIKDNGDDAIPCQAIHDIMMHQLFN